jgi:hypothetical protein
METSEVLEIKLDEICSVLDEIKEAIVNLTQAITNKV